MPSYTRALARCVSESRGADDRHRELLDPREHALAAKRGQPFDVPVLVAGEDHADRRDERLREPTPPQDDMDERATGKGGTDSGIQSEETSVSSRACNADCGSIHYPRTPALRRAHS
jgi:hypothetical protein